MAQPGESFPMQFALGVLNLAQQQKQFNARLREQRSTTAARNFLEKERMDLAERSQRLQEFKAGMGRRPQEFGVIDNFRQRSAESAVGVHDQLALLQGQAQVDRQRELEKRVEDSLPAKLVSDLHAKGSAFVPSHMAGDVIPAMRTSLGIGGSPTGMTEEIRTNEKGETVTTGKVSADPTSKARAAHEAAGNVFEMVEIPTKGGTIVMRVGGNAGARQQSALKIKKAQAEIEKINAEVAEIQSQTESNKALKHKRIVEAKQISDGIGADTEQWRYFTNSIQFVETGQRMVRGMMAPLETERKTLNATLAIADPQSKEFKDASARLIEVGKELDKMTDGLADPATFLLENDPATGKPRNIGFARIAEAFPTAQRAASMSASKRAAGDKTPPDPDIQIDPMIRTVLTKPVADVMTMLSLDPENNMNPKEVWRSLPRNISIPFKDSAGNSHQAAFHADPTGKGLVPLNRMARDLSQQIDRGDTSGLAEGTRAFNLHPNWRLIGWNQETDQVKAKPVSLADVNVAAGGKPQAVVDQEEAATSRRQELARQVYVLMEKAREAKANGQDTSELVNQIKTLSAEVANQ